MFCLAVQGSPIVIISVTFHLTFVHIMLSSVWVAEWPPFGEIAAHSVDHMFSKCILTIVILVISRFGLRAGFWF